MRITCCYKCEKRLVGCHAKCKEYQDMRKALNDINEKRNKEAKIKQETNAVQYHGIEKIRKKEIARGKKVK